MNETQTPASSAMPFLDASSIEIRYGDAMKALNIRAADGESMRYEVTAGAFKGATAEVNYQAEQIGPGLYVLSWREADKGTVVHVDDFAAATLASTTPRPGTTSRAWQARSAKQQRPGTETNEG